MKAQGIVLWDLVEKYFRVSKRVSWLKFWDNLQDGKQIPKDNVAADKTTPKLKKKKQTNKQIKKQNKKDVLQNWYGKVGIWQKNAC